MLTTRPNASQLDEKRFQESKTTPPDLESGDLKLLVFSSSIFEVRFSKFDFRSSTLEVRFSKSETPPRNPKSEDLEIYGFR